MKQVITMRTVYASILFLLLIFNAAAVSAQDSDFSAERERAIRMINDGKFLEALPLFERLAASKQADGEIFFGLGIGLLYKADRSVETVERKAIRVKARNAFLKAKELGIQDADLDMLLSGIKPDGGERGKSDNPQANKAMEEAFAPFAARDFLKAAELYEKAAKLDPTLYEAALYTGNSFYGAKKYEEAGVWFAKAIAIDPNRETAHRYWADALMLSGKHKEAQDKFFDAIIAEPFNQLSWRGLIQFAQRSNIQLAHPKIEIPSNITGDQNGNKMTITLNESVLKGEKDGSNAWVVYGLSRAIWRNEIFAKTFPNEKSYRHSLNEETAALKSVLKMVEEQRKEIKTLNPSLAKLKKLNDEGLLETYILLARADAGIRQDYEAYRQSNRDKLKRYLAEYVVKNGGN